MRATFRWCGRRWSQASLRLRIAATSGGLTFVAFLVVGALILVSFDTSLREHEEARVLAAVEEAVVRAQAGTLVSGAWPSETTTDLHIMKAALEGGGRLVVGGVGSGAGGLTYVYDGDAATLGKLVSDHNKIAGDMHASGIRVGHDGKRTIVTTNGGMVPDSNWVQTTRQVTIDGGTLTIVAGSPGEAVTQPTRVIGGILVLLTGPMAGLVALLAWMTTGRMLQPVREMTEAADRISSTNLSERISGGESNDDLGKLADTFNRMLSRLQESHENEQQFISDASHELRSPIASMQVAVDVAAIRPERFDLEKHIEVMSEELERLDGIVGDLLTLARTGERQVRFTDVDVDEIVLSEAARMRRVPVDVSAVEPGRVSGDADVLRRVFRHLLDNGARHAASTVSVTVTRDGDRVVVYVDDDGDGIEQSQRNAVFGRFVRLSESRARDEGGSGLGLAVVADGVETHGGTICAEDSPLGGARFKVSFPAVLGEHDDGSWDIDKEH